jgi:hypothetical protein
MSDVIQIGVPERPAWARNWWERLQLRFHKTPKHMQAVLDREETILSKAKAIHDLLAISKTHCKVEVLWNENKIRIVKGNTCVGNVAFDLLFSPETSTREIAEHVLSCIKN